MAAHVPPLARPDSAGEERDLALDEEAVRAEVRRLEAWAEGLSDEERAIVDAMAAEDARESPPTR